MISLPNFDWITEIKASYDSDEKLKELLHKQTTWDLPLHYSVRDGLFLYKRRLYIPANPALIKNLLSLVHSSPMGGIWDLTKQFTS